MMYYFEVHLNKAFSKCTYFSLLLLLKDKSAYFCFLVNFYGEFSKVVFKVTNILTINENKT